MGHSRGFTIIEVITVIAIIAITAGIVIPNVIGWLPRYRLNSGAEEIQSTLQFARLTAIKQNKSATVNFDTTNHTFMASVDGQPIKNGKMPAGIIIDSITSPSSEVQFNSRGLANSPNNDILLKNNLGGTKKITVNIVGNSRIH